jgi:Cthe_2314-like HEPN
MIDPAMNALYTAGLTTRLDLEDEIARLFFEDEPEPPKSHVRLQFERLDEADRKAVIAYCEELDCLHEDLDFILFELDQAVTALYSDSLHLKRLAIICYSDSFHFRVHAYREKVFKLINHFLGLKLPDNVWAEKNSNKASGNGFNEKILKLLRATRRAELAQLLEVFHREKALKEAIRFRHLAAHALAHRDWPTVTATRRVDDQALARSAVYELDRETDLDRLHRKVEKRLSALSSRLHQFRRDLLALLGRAVA